MGPWEQTGMSVFKETRQLWLDDVTDSVGQAFLAHAMQCANAMTINSIRFLPVIITV